MLAGFGDKLRLMSLLMDDIRAVKELSIKNCRECAFAHGGHCFAVANNALVQIVNTYTCEVMVNLRGHNGKVRSVCWGKGDRKLVTVGMDGAVFVWSVRQVSGVRTHTRAFFVGTPLPAGCGWAGGRSHQRMSRRRLAATRAHVTDASPRHALM